MIFKVLRNKLDNFVENTVFHNAAKTAIKSKDPLYLIHYYDADIQAKVIIKINEGTSLKELKNFKRRRFLKCH